MECDCGKKAIMINNGNSICKKCYKIRNKIIGIILIIFLVLISYIFYLLIKGARY